MPISPAAAANLQGFCAGPELGRLGLRGSGACELRFDDCEVPAENVLGGENQVCLGAGKVQTAVQLACSLSAGCALAQQLAVPDPAGQWLLH